jgi:hypothetical protein
MPVLASLTWPGSETCVQDTGCDQSDRLATAGPRPRHAQRAVVVPLSGAVAATSIASDLAGVTTTTARRCVIDRIDGPLVPYKNAEPQTKAA